MNDTLIDYWVFFFNASDQCRTIPMVGVVVEFEKRNLGE
jgi:hypothetical protein